MNTKDISALIDLLVDGEADEQTRRELFNLLDDTPGSWKQCALSFLEDQEFKAAITSNNIGSVDFSRPVTPELKAVKKKEAIFSLHMYSALAGCLILGLAVGFALHYISIDSPVIIGSNPEFANDLSTVSQTAHRVYPTLEANPVSPAVPTPQTRLVSLKTSDENVQQFTVPCYDNKTIDPESFRSTHFNTSRNWADQNKRDGHQVQTRRLYYIFPGVNNELILVPSEDTIVQYTGQVQFE